MLAQVISTYNEALFDTDRDQALLVVHEAVKNGMLPEDIVFKVVIPGIETMMKAISEDIDANLAQHFMTAQIALQVTEEMLPHFLHPPVSIGRVVLGTAKGDLHSLGKRILTGCLRSLMIEVIDLGVNVDPTRFVDQAVTHGADVIGISAMMMHTADGEEGCRRVRRILQERGLENRVRVVVGGAPFRCDPDLWQRVGADGWAPDGISAGRVITNLIHEIHA
ncbi:Dimethylamine corrinoid protein [Gammaproteobacteria bacterium]